MRELASLIRSKNAGPFELTFDIMFDDAEPYEAVKRSGAVRTDLFAGLYRVPADAVQIFQYDPAHAFKITIPRPIVSGSVGDSDVYGCQQFGPLADLEINLDIA